MKRFYIFSLITFISIISPFLVISQISYNEMFEIEQFGNKTLIRADNTIFCVDNLGETIWEITDPIFAGKGKRLAGNFVDSLFFYLKPNEDICMVVLFPK